MRRRTAVTAALLGLALSVLPHASADERPLTSADLPRLTQELATVTAQAQELSARLDQAAQRDGGLRVAYARLDDVRYTAQQALDSRAREVYMVPRLPHLQTDLASPALRELARRGERAALQVDRGLVEAVTGQAAQLAALQRQADAFRAQLLVQARGVLAAQDRARELYAQAKALADAERAAAVLAQLEAQRQVLDDVSATVTLALTPAQSRRSQQAARDQGPVVALLEQTGSGIPAGYARSGTVFSGEASWYGPGFVGRPTASGAPYDPEKTTCANKELPLGTVLDVSRAGLETNCLVNDRGPYVGDRVLDMSRAGSRSLGYSGVARVTIEVLVPL